MCYTARFTVALGTGLPLNSLPFLFIIISLTNSSETTVVESGIHVILYFFVIIVIMTLIKNVFFYKYKFSVIKFKIITNNHEYGLKKFRRS